MCPGMGWGGGHRRAAPARSMPRTRKISRRLGLRAGFWVLQNCSLLRHSSAQGTGAPTDKATCEQSSCNTTMSYEVLEACWEYKRFGIVQDDCNLWIEGATTAPSKCRASCSNCSTIATMVVQTCNLMLLAKDLFSSVALEYCLATADAFKYARCPSALVQAPFFECATAEAQSCMRECGNYGLCNCRTRRGVLGEPTDCVGDTILQGTVQGSTSGLQHSCSLMPPKCYNHIVGEYFSCGAYRHCPIDYCIVKGVTCPRRDPCEFDGFCEKSSGACAYASLPDGSLCEDGLDDTHTDVCKSGSCRGLTDYCLRGNVDCVATNPCLKQRGTCDPDTGACVFFPVVSGKLCNSQADGPLDGNCTENGLCVRDIVDLCADSNCSSPGMLLDSCFATAHCEPATGLCVAPFLPEGEPCDDGQDDTGEDRCVEGLCVGAPRAATEFKEADSETCKKLEASGVLRYFGDIWDERKCAEQCKNEPECSVYSFGYNTCVIHGVKKRTHDPDRKYWGTEWILSSDALHVEHKFQCYTKVVHGEVYVDPFDAAKRALIWVSLGCILGFPFCWFIWDQRKLFYKCFGRGENEMKVISSSFSKNPKSAEARWMSLMLRNSLATKRSTGGMTGSSTRIHATTPRSNSLVSNAPADQDVDVTPPPSEHGSFSKDQDAKHDALRDALVDSGEEGEGSGTEVNVKACDLAVEEEGQYSDPRGQVSSPRPGGDVVQGAAAKDECCK